MHGGVIVAEIERLTRISFMIWVLALKLNNQNEFSQFISMAIVKSSISFQRTPDEMKIYSEVKLYNLSMQDL